MAAVVPIRPPEPPDLAALRARIAAIERGSVAQGRAPAVRLGPAVLDRALPGGGLARGAVHEISAAAADGTAGAAGFAAASGFAAAVAGRAAGADGAVLWCARAGDLHAPGLSAFGLDTARLIAVHAPRPEDAAWAVEEALRAGVPAVVGEVAVDLTASRRLHLAARARGGLCLLLRRPDRPAGTVAAATRWQVAPVPAAPRRGGAPGAARWRLSLTRCRGGAPRGWIVEWCHETHRLALVAPLADRAAPARRASPGSRLERTG